MYANFEETRSRDPDLGTLNLRKKMPFLSGKFVFAYIYEFA